ncbi:MAG: hypothetical protein R8P61_16415 [Bacteroidia bacterium]|nr:hypothetical protein [Bacteroidia bacterium]
MKLRICMESGNIQCPEASQDCYGDLGNFYDVWSGELLAVGVDYNTFIGHDTLVTGIFVNGNASPDEGLPACNLPPPPGGGDAYHDANPENAERIYASIFELNEVNNEESIPTGNLLYFNFQKADADSGITIAKFDYSSLGVSDAFTQIRDYYDHQIQIDNNINPKPVRVDVNYDLKGPNGLSTQGFYLEHQTFIRTYIIKMNESSFLRIRCNSSKIPEILNFIEFYE